MMENQNFLYYKNPNHVGNLNDMRLSGKLCDVTLQIEGREIRAHKVILAANLKYFQSMFLNSFEECEKDVVTMKDVDGRILDEFIDFAYTGEILLTNINALGLLETADYLNEDRIQKVCIKFLEQNLRVEDAFRAFTLASAINCASLKNVAKSRILSNFENCSRSREYLDLDFESLKNILVNFGSSYIEPQQMLFEGIMKWITHDLSNRKNYTNGLLGLIDITKLTADYLIAYFYGDAVNQSDELATIKDVVMMFYQNCKQEAIKNPGLEQALILLYEHEENKRSFQIYSFAKKQWSPVRQILNCDGRYSNHEVLHDKLYYTGGDFENYNLQMFDPVTTKSTILYHSKQSLDNVTMCTDGRFLYLCGGYKNFSTALNQILKYDPQSNSIQTLKSMKTCRAGVAATFYQGCLYVLGGYDGRHVLYVVEKYNPDTKKWSSCPSMVQCREESAVAVLDGKLYVCGGDRSRSVEVYDPATNKWQLVASMKQQRKNFLVFVHEGKLVAVGGEEDKTIEIYDPKKNEWTFDCELPSGLLLKYPTSGGLISFRCTTEAK